jgi:hypothetical protein
MHIKYKLSVAAQTLAAVFIAAALVSACNGGGGNPDVIGVTSSCFSDTNPGNLTTNNTFGNFMVLTDIWNPPASYSECVNTTYDFNIGAFSSAQFDWNFTPLPIGVKAYPNLTFGQIPGRLTSTTTKLPALVTSMPNLNVTGTINTACATGVTCQYDNGIDIFFSSTATPTTWPPKAEMMIWTTYNITGYSTGTAAATGVVIGGITFDVYVYPVTIGPDTWPFILYLPRTPITQLNLNIKNFVADTLTHPYGVASTDYLDVVEIGTEIRSGQGSTALTNYNIQ